MSIVFDSSANANSLTVAHTIGNGSNRVLFAVYNGSSASDGEMASCTYNNVQADGSKKINTTQWGSTYGITIFYWLESSLPVAGTYNCVAVPNTTLWNQAVITASFSDVKQEALVGFSADSLSGNEKKSTLGVVSVESNCCFIDSSGCYTGNTVTMTPDSGQISLGTVNQDAYASMSVGHKIKASSGSEDLVWLFSDLEYFWNAVAYVMKPAVIVPAGSVRDMLAHNF